MVAKGEIKIITKNYMLKLRRDDLYGRLKV
jgi:hypothetical protein